MKKIPTVRELGDPIIREGSKPVFFQKTSEYKLRKVFDEMLAVCKKFEGVGVAGNQIGLALRVFLIWTRPTKNYKNIPKIGPILLVNPKIDSKSIKKVLGWEGCMSVPGIRGKVLRHFSVNTTFYDIEGKKISRKFSGFVARVFQHELDHLNGIVFLDRVDKKTLITTKEFRKKISKK